MGEPITDIDKEINERTWLIQGVSDRLCEAHDKKDDFSKELSFLLDKYNINYSVNYNPATFIRYEYDKNGKRI